MAKTFRNLNDLNSYVEDKLRGAMDKVGDQTAKELGDYVFKYWYKANGKPKDYNRTFEFLNSIEFKTTVSGGVIATKVFFNDKLIKPMHDEYSSWNQHMSLTGADVSGNIVGWIEHGQTSKAYSYDGIHMVKNVKEWAKRNYRRLLILEMGKLGIKLE